MKRFSRVLRWGLSSIILVLLASSLFLVKAQDPEDKLNYGCANNQLCPATWSSSGGPGVTWCNVCLPTTPTSLCVYQLGAPGCPLPRPTPPPVVCGNIVVGRIVTTNGIQNCVPVVPNSVVGPCTVQPCL